jgi:hypothetical protein
MPISVTAAGSPTTSRLEPYRQTDSCVAGYCDMIPNTQCYDRQRGNAPCPRHCHDGMQRRTLALHTDKRSASRSACITLSTALGTHFGQPQGRDHLKHANAYRWCERGDMKWLKLARDRLFSTGSEFSVSAIGDEFTD